MTDNATVITLDGEYDLSRRDELDQVLDRFGDAEPLMFDFRDVTRLDTGALRSFVRFQNARREAGRSPVVLQCVTPHIRRVFELAGLADAFDFN